MLWKKLPIFIRHYSRSQIVRFYLFVVRRRLQKVDGDTSLMTYRGHSVLHTLIRCRFSPEFTTGQRYIYSGCATGAVVSKCD